VTTPDLGVALRTVTGDRLRALVRDRTGDPDLAHAVKVVSQVLPFKVSGYVVDELIDWSRVPDDPIFRLTFPHPDMLHPDHFSAVEEALSLGDRDKLRSTVTWVWDRLNPHPGDQLSRNVPSDGDADGDGWGLQHRYRETLLVFPRQGQTCHSYCGYCFRWAQFVDAPGLRLAASGPEVMTRYLDRHPEVTDVLLTGGDPLVMRTDLIRSYLEPLLTREHVHTIRIGTKAVSFWPYRLLAGDDADALAALLERLVDAGKHVAIMLHLSHPVELGTDAARAALRRLTDTGAVLRSQAPVVRHVNDDPQVWARMWQEQVRHKVVPYYMFVERDTGARCYFGLPIARALEVYQGAFRQVSGLARTARGPVMSTSPGKVVVDGVIELDRGPAFALRFLQARDPELVGRPFFARFDPRAEWWDELRPYGPRDRVFFPGAG